IPYLIAPFISIGGRDDFVERGRRLIEIKIEYLTTTIGQCDYTGFGQIAHMASGDAIFSRSETGDRGMSRGVGANGELSTVDVHKRLRDNGSGAGIGDEAGEGGSALLRQRRYQISTHYALEHDLRWTERNRLYVSPAQQNLQSRSDRDLVTD